ncbi:hypothetical protein AVEN_207155-1 [Araneus ventricosus]|uniref:Uncharacterized protein n=1 Tax=Araneus ventricosus TaxID=182803 RepID=A0A4Y2TKK5_ARAVE|nr:hypothetical protein AVEN_207155-1 [Araneus ventricosus]
MTRTIPELAPPSKFRTTPKGGRLATTYDLTCPHTRRISGGIGVSYLEPSGPEAETLPPGHRGLSITGREEFQIHNQFSSLHLEA